jgi:hypothetical protein
VEEVNKGGRPPRVISPDELIQIEALAGYLSKAQIADFLGISHVTLQRCEERQEEVSLALKKGKATQIKNVAQSLSQKAIDGHVTAAIFYLKTQAGWVEADNPDQDSRPINIQIVQPDAAG